MLCFDKYNYKNFIMSFSFSSLPLLEKREKELKYLRDFSLNIRYPIYERRVMTLQCMKSGLDT